MKKYKVEMDDVSLLELVQQAPLLLKEVARQKALDEALVSTIQSPEVFAEKEALRVEEKLKMLDKRLKNGIRLLLD